MGSEWKAGGGGGRWVVAKCNNLGFEDLFVIGVGADPEPDDGVAGHDAEGAVSCVDPGGPEGFDFLKAKGAVFWVFGPKAVLLAVPLLFIAREGAGLTGTVIGEGFLGQAVEATCLDIGIDLTVPSVVKIYLAQAGEELVLFRFAQFANGVENFGHAHEVIFGGKRGVSMRLVGFGNRGRRPSVALNLADSGGAMEGLRWKAGGGCCCCLS